MRRFWRRRLLVASGVLTLAAWGILLAPTELGGEMAYVVLLGTSMEPGMSAGDLMLVRERSDYRVGDVVAYRNPDLRQAVVHRIVGRAGDRYVLAGDNNSWKDSYRPTASEFLGEPLVRIPALGGVLVRLATPLPVAAVTGGLVFLVIARPPGDRGRRPRVAGVWAPR